MDSTELGMVTIALIAALTIVVLMLRSRSRRTDPADGDSLAGHSPDVWSAGLRSKTSKALDPAKAKESNRSGRVWYSSGCGGCSGCGAGCGGCGGCGG